MAHFAQIDSDSIVTQVIVVADSDAAKDASQSWSTWNEAGGIAFCRSLLGADTNWVQTSYNNNIRFRYAGIGMKYDSTNDVFYEQSPYPSWVLNTSTWDWDAPVALPDDAGVDDADNPTEVVSYEWDEDSTTWTNRTVVTY
tara:strand:+ start:483 stop:905 length:423 start_codon:yes stop_codon:yes gene_type:complete